MFGMEFTGLSNCIQLVHLSGLSHWQSLMQNQAWRNIISENGWKPQELTALTLER